MIPEIRVGHPKRKDRKRLSKRKKIKKDKETHAKEK